MDVIEAMDSRISVRGYKPTPVPQKILTQILEAATKCPSSRNVQPWEFAIVTGDTLDKIKQGTTEKFSSGVEPNPDIVYDEVAEGRHEKYTLDSLYHIWDNMGIKREDAEAREQWGKLMVTYFDAPAAIYIFRDDYFDAMATQFDLGIVTGSICLAAVHYGLGTCVMRSPLDYPDVIRKYVNIPKSKLLVITVAIGYPDWDYPANRGKTTRESIDKLTTWYGFD